MKQNPSQTGVLESALLEAFAGFPSAKFSRLAEKLVRNPENGWSLSGLEQSLRAQGSTTAADEVQKRLNRAWARADRTLLATK